MLKKYYNITKHGFWRLIAIGSIFILSLAILGFTQTRKEIVTFQSADSLTLTADHYFLADTLPYLILIHEQGSSRGEFETLAERFQKMDYNCLAVDIRNGGNANFISNETVRRFRQGDFNIGREDIEADIRASVNYAFSISNQKVVLLGSGATGSLCLKISKEMEEIRGAIAFSPGEFYRPTLIIEDTIAGIQKPLFVSSTEPELPYLEQMLSGVDDNYKTIFKPESSGGIRGASALESKNPSNAEYWMALLLFFKELK